ncbi:MAG: hypothetical protein JW884_03510 [Deltaproteobacteria bacterium]|nr:hypothetical protein [Deltaproteobacteria bacterium]
MILYATPFIREATLYHAGDEKKIHGIRSDRDCRIVPIRERFLAKRRAVKGNISISRSFHASRKIFGNQQLPSPFFREEAVIVIERAVRSIGIRAANNMHGNGRKE